MILTTSNDYYYTANYRDCFKQNPPRKLDHYIGVIDRHSKTPSLDILDIGCGLGEFLERTQ